MITGYARRNPRGRIFGQGFDPPQLHHKYPPEYRIPGFCCPVVRLPLPRFDPAFAILPLLRRGARVR